MVEGFPDSWNRFDAIDKLNDLTHVIYSRGPEGPQTHWDENGKVVTSKSRVDFQGLRDYETSLRKRAGWDWEVSPVADKAEATQSAAAGKANQGLDAINLLAKAFGGSPIDA